MSAADELQKLGLTDGESKVYLALLKQGSSTVGPIVKESKVAYSNIYEILDRLVDKGLVSFIVKSKTHYYQAVAPNRVKDYLVKKEQELEEQKTILESLVPKLELLQKTAQNTAEAEVFIGWKAMRSAQEKLVADAKAGDEELFFFDSNAVYTEAVDRFFISLQETYREKKIKMRGISQEIYVKESASYISQKDYLTMRHVSFPIPSGIDICNDKILLSAWSTPLCVLITSKELAQNFRSVFEDIWKKAKS